MNVKEYLWGAARCEKQSAMPVLSFPAVQKLNVSVLELLRSSELQARAMQIIAQETDTLASVSLMDLSVEAEAFGASVQFEENEVPNVFGQLIEDEQAAEALEVPSLDKGRAPICLEAVRIAKQNIREKPVLAGVIGPYSLAGRLMDVTQIMFACLDDPDAVHIVLDKATRYITDYCLAFKEAGADGVVIAEPLAGLLSAEMAQEFSCTYVRRIIEAVQSDDFAVIYHNCGNTTVHMLAQLFAMEATAYHFGNAVDMKQILEKAPETALCMGNIDPAGVFAQAEPEGVRAATLALLDACGEYKNFILSSGCDIPARAPWKNIEAFFAAVDEWNQAKR